MGQLRTSAAILWFVATLATREVLDNLRAFRSFDYMSLYAWFRSELVNLDSIHFTKYEPHDMDVDRNIVIDEWM